MLMRAPSMRVWMLLVLSQIATTVGFAHSFFGIARSGERRYPKMKWLPGPDSNQRHGG